MRKFREILHLLRLPRFAGIQVLALMCWGEVWVLEADRAHGWDLAVDLFFLCAYPLWEMLWTLKG